MTEKGPKDGIPWFGVEWEGTLAKEGSLLPVPLMVERVQWWLRHGKEVWVMTQRTKMVELEEVQAWCKEHIGQALPIIATRPGLQEVWSTRAVPVIRNEGVRLDGKGDAEVFS